MKRATRRSFLVAAGVAALAGCSGGGDGADAAATTRTDGASGGASPEVPFADRTLPLPSSPEQLRTDVESGGTPKDGIGSIDDPAFVEAGAADEFLAPGDVVFGVARDGVAKAYPQKILVSHEICNDTIAGTPVSVTYCPLTGTVLGFERGDTTFGVSGRLLNNNLVMYDRSTEAWWPQVLATAIPGPWNEDPPVRSLREFRLVWTTWERWNAVHPTTRVLSGNTGYIRNYDRDPYGSYNPKQGYYDRETTLFPVLNYDDRYRLKRVVVGARTPKGAVAFLKDALAEHKLLEGTLAGTRVVAVYDPALDTGYVYRVPETVGVEFRGGTVDTTDGTTHAPDELPFPRIHAFDAMWFAWSGFYPETAVYG